MFRRLAAVILSVVLLSPGWLGMTGLTLPFAMIPLLWISASYDQTRRSWWRMFGWAALTFALWNISTVWWIWNATPVGPVAATLASTTLNMIAFMLFHTVSKKGPKALAYTLLIAGWIATEYWYTVGEFSWPWLILGNGFSHDVWLVQWYEYTGVFGGSLWVLLCNILFFEALRARRSIGRWIPAAGVLLLPAAVSLGIWWSWEQPDEGTAEVSILQPNVDCYDKFNGRADWQEDNITDLLAQVPAGAQFILLPETAVPGHYWEPELSELRPADEPGMFWQELTDNLRRSHPGALLVTGANTLRYYAAGVQPRTARRDGFGEGYYDVFNTAVGLDSAGRMQLHHKGKLVIGVENTPDTALRHPAIPRDRPGRRRGTDRHGPARHGLRTPGRENRPGNLLRRTLRRFLRRFRAPRAQFMAIISNDGWWGDTPGYKHLFTISRLRAVEHRRAIARSANTGMSGFISARGDIGQTLGWEKRGVLTAAVPLNSELTFYTRYGDYLGRISEYLMLLCVLYYIAYRAKKKNHLVK